MGCHEGSPDVDVIPRLRGCEEADARKNTYAFLAQLNMIADVVGVCIYIEGVVLPPADKKSHAAHGQVTLSRRTGR